MLSGVVLGFTKDGCGNGGYRVSRRESFLVIKGGDGSGSSDLRIRDLNHQITVPSFLVVVADENQGAVHFDELEVVATDQVGKLICKFFHDLVSSKWHVEFKRISLIGFRSCTSRSHYQSVSKQTTRYPCDASHGYKTEN
ncbi:hypothetical protein Tco_0653613 [Tanacetum coccineum]|uniref:PLAT domain-containing protein n=1 Tax=Tanacetum coccineum TaxID=301880 RepID=A0ABQ4X0W2_9ASTR